MSRESAEAKKARKAFKQREVNKEEVKKTAKVSRERLERITKNRKHHLRTTGRVLKYGSKSFVRNAWLSMAAIAIMIITLTVLSVTIIAANVMDTAVRTVEDQVDISVYLKQNASLDQVSKVRERLLELETVTEVKYVSPEEANNNTIKQLIADNHIEDDAIKAALYEAPNKIPWTLNIKLVNLNETSELQNFVESDPMIQTLLDSQEPTYSSKHRQAIDNISSIITRIEYVGLIAAVVFALIAVLVIFNTIRMAIFNRREEIDMMKLVGASRWFIVGPFVIEASWYGVIAAIVAIAIVYVGMSFLNTSMASIVAPTYDLMTTYWYFVSAALVVVGIFIGVLSSLLAVRKHINTR